MFVTDTNDDVLTHVVIDVAAQTLSAYRHERVVRTFAVSTAKAGTGQRSGSFQTPLGRHVIRARIGAGQPVNAVFAGRRPTGEIWSPELHDQHPERDWILTRILWLSGTEPGFNRLGDVDSMRRYIYLHGTPDIEPMGSPASHGCIRMRNEDLLWLFERVSAGIVVTIESGQSEPSTAKESVLTVSTHAPAANRLGPIMIDVDGLTLTARDRELLVHPLTGGLILFSRNYANRDQLKQLVQAVRAVNAQLVIAVDQEGGRVQRFRDGFSAFPPMRAFGALHATHPDLAVQRAEDCGWVLGQELAACDIDLTFAPVVDLDYGASEVIGDRAFAREPADVVALARAFMGGLHCSGTASCIKHFPGHGFVVADSHHELPVDERDEQALEKDLVPFTQLAATARAVMTAHVLAPCVDDKPVSFSSFWVQTRLKGDLGFGGVVFSDDLSMKGADSTGGVEAKVAQALSAGCDFLPICNDREAVERLYRNPPTEAESFSRSAALTRLRRASRPVCDYASTNRYRRFQEFLTQLEHTNHAQ